MAPRAAGRPAGSCGRARRGALGASVHARSLCQGQRGRAEGGRETERPELGRWRGGPAHSGLGGDGSDAVHSGVGPEGHAGHGSGAARGSPGAVRHWKKLTHGCAGETQQRAEEERGLGRRVGSPAGPVSHIPGCVRCTWAVSGAEGVRACGRRFLGRGGGESLLWQEGTWHPRRWPRPGPVPMFSPQSREEPGAIGMDGRFAATWRRAVYTSGTSTPTKGSTVLPPPNAPPGAPRPPRRLPRGQGSAVCFHSVPTWAGQGLLCQESGEVDSALPPVRPLRRGQQQRSGRWTALIPDSPPSLQAGQRPGSKLQSVSPEESRRQTPPPTGHSGPTAAHTRP